MSGSVSIPSYLPTLFAASSQGDSLLATLYGNAGSTTRGTINPIAALLQARTGEAKQVAVIAVAAACGRARSSRSDNRTPLQCTCGTRQPVTHWKSRTSAVCAAGLDSFTTSLLMKGIFP